ncbi:MAG: NfeD family protein [Actinomycetota bacterium]|jgi:membrane protein implicated in regulation of membrane protease activity|nr:NfeD family protein [Actinomycetota bacterium]
MGEALWWFAIAAVFLVAEFGHRAFYALFVALGAVVAAVLALAGVGVIVQIPAFVAAAVLGLLLLRPAVARAMSAGQYRLVSGIKGHVGHEAIVAETVGGPAHPGRIRINGELWKAVSQDSTSIAPDTVVMILDLQNTTFVVQDLPALGLAPLELPEDL